MKNGSDMLRVLVTQISARLNFQALHTKSYCRVNNEGMVSTPNI